jgi:hypothetical protein
MRYWTRTTHNFNNESREWTFNKKILPYSDVSKFGLGVHALDNGRWMTEREIFSQYDSYYNENPDEDRPTNDEIVEQLKAMEKNGLVKSKES